MKNKLKLIHAAALAVALAGVSAQAASIEWDSGAGDGVWTNALNWAGDVLPGDADLAYISTGETVIFQEGYTNTTRQQIIRGGSTLNITGGKLEGSKSGNTVRDIVGQTSGHSYLNQSGGFYQCSHILRIGSGALGTVNLSGGSANISRGGNALIGGNPGTSVQIGSLGTLNITNSTFWTRTGVEIDGGGMFHVYGGYSPEILIGHSSGQVSDGDWFQSSNAVLKVGISTNGLTPIVLENNAEAGDPIVTLDFGSVLDVSFVDGAMETNFWPVLDASSGIAFNNLGLVFDAGVDTNDWGFIVSNKVLYVGYGLGWPAGEEVIGPPSPGRTLYWTGAGGDSDSSNPTNWVLDLAASVTADWGPYDMDLWRIAHSSVAGIEQGTNYAVDYDATAVNNGQADIDVGDGAQGTLNYNSGNLSFGVTGSRQEFGVNANGDGTLNMNGGDLNLNTVRFGLNGGTGTLNLNGGTLNIGRGYGDYSMWIGHGGSSTGTVNVTGGRVFTRTGVKLGDGGAIGIFNIEGSVASVLGIGSNNSIDGNWVQNAGSILRVRMDAGGVTPISIVNKIDNPTNDVNSANVTFNTGSVLDVGWMPGVTNYNTFDLMTWDGELMESNLTFASSVDTSIWSFEFVDTNADTTNDTLRATAYGETANGTPFGWLLDYGLTGDDDEVDNDGDGLLTWEEYRTGTNPTNSASVLAVTGGEGIGGGDFVITWQSVEGVEYSVITNTSLVFPNRGTEASGIVGLPTETSYTGSVNAADAVFYEVGVE